MGSYAAEGHQVRVDEIFVSNFKYIDEVRLNLSASDYSFGNLHVEHPIPSVCLISGPSMSGKTSLMGALRVGIGAWFRGGVASHAVSAPNIKKSDVRRDDDLSVVSVLGAHFDGEMFSYEVTRRNDRTYWSTTLRKGSPVLPVLAFFSEHFTDSENTNDFNFGHFGVELSGMGYEGALDYERVNTRTHMRWDKLTNMSRSNDVALSTVKEVDSTLSTLLTEGTVEYVWTGATKVGAMDYRQPVVRVGESRYRLPEIDVIDRNVLLIGMDLAMRSLQLNPQRTKSCFSTPGICLIDDVRRQLGTNFVERLTGLSRVFPNVQFICTAMEISE